MSAFFFSKFYFSIVGWKTSAVKNKQGREIVKKKCFIFLKLKSLVFKLTIDYVLQFA